MKNRVKKSKCTYFEVVSTNEETGDEELYDLRLWLARINGGTLADRKKEMNSGDEGRLERILEERTSRHLMNLNILQEWNQYQRMHSLTVQSCSQ